MGYTQPHRIMEEVEAASKKKIGLSTQAGLLTASLPSA